MWTWEKILKCREIERGVRVESKFCDLHDLVLVKIGSNYMSMVGSLGVVGEISNCVNFDDFKFYHTTGEEILPPKERETITLYETIENNCNSVYCDKDGNKYDLVEKEIKFSFDYFKKQRKANINKNKSVVLYADTFEVKEWRN